MDKPLSLIINETKQNMVAVINNSGLPLPLLEMLMKDIYIDIKTANDMQLKKDIEQYNNSLTEESKKQETNVEIA